MSSERSGRDQALLSGDGNPEGRLLRAGRMVLRGECPLLLDQACGRQGNQFVLCIQDEPRERQIGLLHGPLSAVRDRVRGLLPVLPDRMRVVLRRQRQGRDCRPGRDHRGRSEEMMSFSKPGPPPR